MPLIDQHTYHPGGLLKNGHYNTFYPYIFRKDIDISYRRERLNTPDGDFLDIDWIQRKNNRLVILCHGLEGSSDSKYIKYTALLSSKNNWDVLALNYRGCSEEMNRKIQMYHSGFTRDIHFLIEKFHHLYDEIALVGFSLGGNMVLKYCGDGEFTLSEKIRSVVGVSVPCDLEAGAYHIGRKRNYIYEKKFLVSLIKKIKIKKQQFPDKIKLDPLKSVKSLIDFDEHYTAPLHGFEDAIDYYRKNRCIQFLPDIKIPGLIISAKDDPFLPDESYPYEEAAKNEHLFLITPDYGGHVGFAQRKKFHYWIEKQINKFIDEPHMYY